MSCHRLTNTWTVQFQRVGSISRNNDDNHIPWFGETVHRTPSVGHCFLSNSISMILTAAYDIGLWCQIIAMQNTYTCIPPPSLYKIAVMCEIIAYLAYGGRSYWKFGMTSFLKFIPFGMICRLQLFQDEVFLGTTISTSTISHKQQPTNGIETHTRNNLQTVLILK